jgi:hypothetical protein
MKAKKTVFFLLLGLVSCALATLLINKFDLLHQTKSWTPEEALTIKLLRGHKQCLLTAGLKLDLVPTEHINQYRLQSLMGLPLELKGQLQVEDLIMGPQLMVPGSLIGEMQTLQVLDPKTGRTRGVNYTVQPVIDCK